MRHVQNQPHGDRGKSCCRRTRQPLRSAHPICGSFVLDIRPIDFLHKHYGNARRQPPFLVAHRPPNPHLQAHQSPLRPAASTSRNLNPPVRQLCVTVAQQKRAGRDDWRGARVVSNVQKVRRLVPERGKSLGGPIGPMRCGTPNRRPYESCPRAKQRSQPSVRSPA